jgi:hypothetical protein
MPGVQINLSRRSTVGFHARGNHPPRMAAPRPKSYSPAEDRRAADVISNQQPAFPSRTAI